MLSDGNFLPNKTYDFIPMDTAERFKTNCLENENNLSLYYYKINPIEYKLNNCGFRTNDDFDLENEGNIFLGCSHSFGIGHHLENIWSYKLSKVIGDKFWNLSLPGTGVTSHFRILLYSSFAIL